MTSSTYYCEDTILLKADEVHLWLASPHRVLNSKQIVFYEGLLDTEEYCRYQRFHFPEHRKQFLTAHALLRLALSRYAPIAPADWRFVRNRYGHPEISNTLTAPLRFSLSHTDGMTLCAVTPNRDIGTDIENIQRLEPDSDLIKRVLSDTERNDLRQQAASSQTAAFFKYWTLKEAYLKARGLGLSIFPNHVSFDLKPINPTAEFHDPLNDEPTNWHFSLLQISNHHTAAIAVRGYANPSLLLYNEDQLLVDDLISDI